MEPNGQAGECKEHPSQKDVNDSDNPSNRNALEDSKCACKSDVHVSYIAFLHIYCSYLVRNEKNTAIAIKITDPLTKQVGP